MHDGDGIRTCVFLKGCPLRCIWCHNPESFEKLPELSFNRQKCSSCGMCLEVCDARNIKNSAVLIEREKCIRCGNCVRICPVGANEIIGCELTAQQVIDEVMKDRIFYGTSGGLTVTGGEPSFQPDFTLELLRLAKDNGIGIAIETCGIGSPDFYEKCSRLGATFLYDIKCIDPVAHKRLTGSDNERILSNLQFLMDSGADIIIRLPMIPGCNDSDEDIARLSEFLNKNKDKFRYAEIMPYHNLGIAKAEKRGSPASYVHKSATEEDIKRWVSLFSENSVNVRVSE